MTLEELAGEIALAAERDSNDYATMLAKAVQREKNLNSVLLLHAAGVQMAPLTRWLQTSLQEATISVMSVEEKPMYAATTADHVVLVFPCSGIPGSNWLANWHAIVEARPPKTYSIILEGSEDIQSENDLQMVESNVWRWLLPTKEDKSLPLNKCGALMWSSVTSTRDERDLILARMTLGMTDEERQFLNQRRLALAISELESSTAESRGATVREISTGDDEIERIRALVLEQTRSMREDAKTALNLAIDDLESRFEREWSQFGNAIQTAPPSQSDLQRFAQSWLKGGAVQSVNSILAGRHQANVELVRTCPALTALPPSLRGQIVAEQIAESLWRTDMNQRRQVRVKNSYGRTFGAALLTPLLAIWIGLGPVAIIGGTVAFTAGALTVDRISKQTAQQKGARSDLLDSFRQWLTHARPTFQQVLEQLMFELIADWKAFFDAGHPSTGQVAPTPIAPPIARWKEILANVS